ncbi:MAG: ATP-binding protein, partial [Myxococcales bacterium]|nr:ATP-binding protein [Myxococcales bacterium]
GRAGIVLGGAIQDLTDRREAEARLRAAEKMDALGTLAAGVAHDFNNVLLAIRSHAELAADDLPQESQAAKGIRQIIRSTRRAGKLVQQILAFSRKAEVHFADVDLGRSVANALEMLRATLPSTLEIRSRIESPVPVHADAAQLERIVLNLGTNAYQAMGSRGILELEVEQTSLSPEECWRLGLAGGGPCWGRVRVRDSGPGIPEEHLDHIFEPFFSTKGPAGTGLGLSVVMGIVKSHGGMMDVRSTPGSGTVFSIYLPLGERVGKRTTAPPTFETLGTERILLVDDDEAVARGTRRLLERMGYRVLPFGDPKEALATLRASPERIDLVITDHTMPLLTGVDIARISRSIRPELPVLLMTGYQEVIERSALDLFADVLAKPFGRAELGMRVRAVFERAEGAAELRGITQGEPRGRSETPGPERDEPSTLR